MCVCLCARARARSGPYGTQVVLTVRKKGSKTQLEVPLVRGSPVYWYFYDENAKLLGRLRELEDRESSIIREWDSRLEMQRAKHEAQLAEQQSAMEAALARLKREHEAAKLAQMKEHNDAMSAASAKHAAALQVCLWLCAAFNRRGRGERA